MSEPVFTPRQCAFVAKLRRGELRRINLLDGSVRSGKTWISLVVWALWVATRPIDGFYLMAGKTLTSLRRNCLELLQTLVGSANFVYSLSRKEGLLFGRRIYIEGVNDTRAEAKIRGMTLHGAYCDELTLFTEDFFDMLLSRLSVQGAKLFATTNPDNPMHWLNDKWIRRRSELDMLYERFLIDDNTFLDPVFVTAQKAEHKGVFYERFILGRWVAANGVIYRDFADDREPYLLDEAPHIALATLGVDFGGNGSANAFSCTGFTRGMREMVTLEEFYLKRVVTPTELEKEFVAFAKMCREKYPVAAAYCDSAEQTLIQGLRTACARARIGIEILNARKEEIVDRIRFMSRMMSARRYKIMRHCKITADALANAVWDDKTQGKDVRLDDGSSNIDSLDALEYSFEPYMRGLTEVR